MDYKKAAIQPLIYLGTLAKWMLFSVITGGRDPAS